MLGWGFPLLLPPPGEGSEDPRIPKLGKFGIL